MVILVANPSLKYKMMSRDQTVVTSCNGYIFHVSFLLPHLVLVWRW